MQTIFGTTLYRVQYAKAPKGGARLYVIGTDRSATFRGLQAMGIAVAFDAIREGYKGDPWGALTAAERMCAGLLAKHGE